MVKFRGLTVEKQKVGLAEQGSSQCETHSPTSREGPGCVLLSFLGETKTSQDTGGPRFGLVGFHLGELGINVAQGNIQAFPFVV